MTVLLLAACLLACLLLYPIINPKLPFHAMKYSFLGLLGVPLFGSITGRFSKLVPLLGTTLMGDRGPRHLLWVRLTNWLLDPQSPHPKDGKPCALTPTDRPARLGGKGSTRPALVRMGVRRAHTH